MSNQYIRSEEIISFNLNTLLNECYERYSDLYPSSPEEFWNDGTEEILDITEAKTEASEPEEEKIVWID